MQLGRHQISVWVKMAVFLSALFGVWGALPHTVNAHTPHGFAHVAALQQQRWNGVSPRDGFGSFVKGLSDNGGDLGNPRRDGIPDINISERKMS